MAPTFRAKTRKITATLPNVAKVKFLSDAAHALMAASVPELAGYLGRQVLQVSVAEQVHAASNLLNRLCDVCGAPVSVSSDSMELLQLPVSARKRKRKRLPLTKRLSKQEDAYHRLTCQVCRAVSVRPGGVKLAATTSASLGASVKSGASVDAPTVVPSVGQCMGPPSTSDTHQSGEDPLPTSTADGQVPSAGLLGNSPDPGNVTTGDLLASATKDGSGHGGGASQSQDGGGGVSAAPPSSAAPSSSPQQQRTQQPFASPLPDSPPVALPRFEADPVEPVKGDVLPALALASDAEGDDERSSDAGVVGELMEGVLETVVEGVAEVSGGAVLGVGIEELDGGRCQNDGAVVDGEVLVVGGIQEPVEVQGQEWVGVLDPNLVGPDSLLGIRTSVAGCDVLGIAEGEEVLGASREVDGGQLEDREKAWPEPLSGVCGSNVGVHEVAHPSAMLREPVSESFSVVSNAGSGQHVVTQSPESPLGGLVEPCGENGLSPDAQGFELEGSATEQEFGILGTGACQSLAGSSDADVLPDASSLVFEALAGNGDEESRVANRAGSTRRAGKRKLIWWREGRHWKYSKC